MPEIVIFLGNLKKVHTSRAESLGFVVNTTITETANYVVCGKDAGIKADKARELGLTILEEEEWEEMLIEREKGDSDKSVDGKKVINNGNENTDENLFKKPTTYMTAGSQYWEIKLDGRKTYIRTGKVGEKGLISKKEHKSWSDAKQSMTDLVERKKRQGFQRQRKPAPNISESNATRRKRQKIDDDSGASSTASTVDDGIDMVNSSTDEDVANMSIALAGDGHHKPILGERADKSSDESSSDNLTNYIFKRSPGLPSSITRAKPVSIMKGRVPELLLAHSWKEDEVDPTGWWISEKLDGSTVSIVKAGTDEWKSIIYDIFDAPSYKNAPFEDRMLFIEDMFEKQKPTYGRIVQQKLCRSSQDVWDELKRVESIGGEGLMIRKPRSEYVCSRSNVLLKVKSFFDGEALVEGYEPGKGKYHNMCQDLSDSGNPRFPTFVGIAADKDKPKDPDFGHKLKLK
ncbi:16080_t:CDS:2 [Acaulospora colombiana]|uniref:16080_t:CDS:1 n=1 Tax=Acaulospora colombiana TaxID=27376 RepID=A0ACA9KHF9_9GLOM|nr:16080_t:CDS:2 [Acaulospora colombiana]